jgi:pyrrolidone-carboxylate peptidase
LKINNSITVPLPLKSAKELAQKLMEVQEDVVINLNFASGKKTTVEINWDSEDKE